MPIEITVVVCTHNHANMLTKAISSLIQQTLNKDLYEIIVVDNASTDNTAQVVRKFRDYYPECNILLVYEDLLGVGNARNTGIRHAHGNYIAFIDDDTQANANWLEQALLCFKQAQPTVLAIGGPILPLYDAPKPQWFKDEYEIRTWGNQPRFLKRGESFSGSNVVFRQDVFETYGGFNIHVGVKGEYLSIGEETALFTKIWQANDEHSSIFYYSPLLTVLHSIPSDKMSVFYRLKRAFITGQVNYSQREPMPPMRRLKYLIGILISIVRRTCWALVHMGEYSAYQNWMVGALVPVAIDLGRLTRCLGISIRVRQR